ncbi:hypothetical protein [Azospira sp. I09]|jgi:hypothetical protein|uniref:hypothetical protein n=1 Tax=Azospira sp. I09 TaxID=1765049 RepID=UPI00129FDB0A|nr:hypothetical protein [Azospira sp. I09]BBN90236.1 hypothetical protein AZSP09_32590 [Azospira sp. I09]
MALSNVVFSVNDAPFCIWDVSLAERNLEFLEQFDSDYFEYLAITGMNGLEDEHHQKRAALLMRQGLYHGLETLFSMLGALIQAPDCVYGWVLKCNPGDVRKIVQRINQGDDSLPRRLVMNNVSWKELSYAIFAYSNSDEDEVKRNADNFCMLWQKLAAHYLKEEYIAEYNGIKHGFRIRSGGFGLRVGRESEYGVPPPPEAMKTIGYSKFGSSFLTLEKVPVDEKQNRSYRSRKMSLNWSAEQVALLLQLVSMSLGNVISALKIVNGIPPSDVQFFRPIEPDAFEKPWQVSVGVTSSTMDYSIDAANFEKTTTQQLQDIVRSTTEACRNAAAR